MTARAPSATTSLRWLREKLVTRSSGLERVEGADLDAGSPEVAPERARGVERAEGVVQHAHLDAGAGARDQRVGEAPARPCRSG